MRRPISLVLALAALAAAGCTMTTDAPTAARGGELAAARNADAPAHGSRSYTAHLTAAAELADVVSRAQGQAHVKVSKDGTSLEFRLNVANIDDVLMAHFHLGTPEENGPVVVWLYPEAPPPQLIPGRTSGTLAFGTVTADDLVGPLAGMSFDALLEAIEDGRIYVNVHTTAYPGGEIRGTLR